jgi:hypothetical protein
MDADQLKALDAAGYNVVEAVAHVKGPPQGSHANPHAFACLDGKTYWVKAQAQQGLCVELVAGRLAAKVGAGPMAKIIHVPNEALPSDGSANHLAGLLVGVQDEEGLVNIKDLGLMGVSNLQAESVRPRDRANVVVFQSWMSVSDQQMLLDLRSGRLVSIDHGECFSDTNAVDPTLIVTDIPGVPAAHGKTKEHVAPALEQVESVSDADLLSVVAQMPSGSPWNADASRRLAIAKCLAGRRDRLRGAIEGWLAA